MNKGIARWKTAILLCPIILLLPACATYSDHLQGVYSHLEQQQPDAALAELDKRPGPQRDRLAYLLNRAMLLRMTADYETSNQMFEQAKVLIEELDAISLREQAGALSINEALRSYPGEPHEHILLHLYAALNYLQTGQLDSARVEALQVNLRLQEFSKKSGHKESYSEDPFAHYLTAMIYEELNEWSDAMIAYRDAYKAYQRNATILNIDTPEFLKHDLLRLSAKMGLNDELSRYQETFGINEYLSVSDLKTQGELIFILHNGLAPQKKQQVSSVIDYGTGRLVTIALPYYISKNKHAQHADAFINDQQYSLEIVTDINAVAQKILETQLPALTARAIARVIIKENAARRIQEDQGAIAGLIINIAAAVTEVADTRSWWSLPNNIQVLRIPLAAGDYDLTIELKDAGENPLGSLYFSNITITAGHKTFIEHHWIKATTPYTATPSTPEPISSNQEDNNET